MALEADSMTGGVLDEGLKGGCMGIMLPQENATEPLGKHAHSSAHQTLTAARSKKAAFGDILKKISHMEEFSYQHYTSFPE